MYGTLLDEDFITFGWPGWMTLLDFHNRTHDSIDLERCTNKLNLDVSVGRLSRTVYILTSGACILTFSWDVRW